MNQNVNEILTKEFMTVKEIAKITSVGEKKIRQLSKMHLGTEDNFTVYCGRKVLIDKMRFFNYLRKNISI